MHTALWFLPASSLLLGCPAPKDVTDDVPGDSDSPVDDTADTDDSDPEDGAPSAPVVSILPAAPSGTADLVVQIDSPAVDPEGKSVTYRYAWAVDGASRADLVTSTVPATELAQDSVWSVEVFPADASQEGDAGTASVTVHNDAPTMAAHLEPEVPIPGDVIYFIVDEAAADPNGDAVTTTIKWYKNDAYRLDWDGLTEISALQVRGGDRFRVEYWVDDTLLTSEVMTDEVTVTNTPPVIDSATLTTSTPKDDDDISALVQADDEDDNDLTYTYVWYRNGVAATDVGDSSTVLASATEVDDTWYCEVTVSDGTDTAVAVTATATVIPWEGEYEIYTFTATIPADASTSTGTWAIDYLSHGTRSGENDCELLWTFAGTEDSTVCPTCEFRFDTVLTYDAASSTVVTGCDAAGVDGTGSWQYFEEGTSFSATLTGPEFGGSTTTRMAFAGSGGETQTYGSTVRIKYYSVTSSEDSAGNTELLAYWRYGQVEY